MPRAVRYDEFGGTDVLRVDEVERPVPGDGQVPVRVKAAGINPSEAVIRTGAVAKIFPSTFPSGQGGDLAGVIEEIGAGVGGFSPGDEVIGFSQKRASQAELVLVEAGDLTRKPEKVSWEVAGSLYVVGVTAWGAVHAVQPEEGETVVISGAAGGVGSNWPSPSASRPSGSTPSSITRRPRSTGSRLTGEQRPVRAPRCSPRWPA
jgi:NADPH:quinone reductase-like Zn-dependent oxidoreductase